MARLEELGLDPSRIREWLDACYPAQVDLVLRDYGDRYSAEELFQMGMNGIRGMKPGIKKQRQTDRVLRERTVRELRQREKSRTAAPTQEEIDALIEEFL